MSEKDNAEPGPFQTSDLRREAERRLRDKEAAFAPTMSDADVRALFHELQVHQIELEMQNEELLRVQTALQDVSDKYQDLFDFAPIGYFLLDEQGRILEVNLAGAALLGVDRSAAAHQRLGQYVAPQARTRFTEFCRRVLSADEKQLCVTELQRGDGRIDALLEGILSHDDRGNRAFRLIVTDITERKRIKEELRQAKEAAEQANRAKDRFLAVLSHELRTPLMPIVLGVSMLQDKPGLDSSVREVLEMIRRNAEMETLLIDDLLDTTRIASGKMQLHIERVELGTIIHNAIAVCRPDIEVRKLEFDVDMGSAGPYWIEADPRRLQQVFWNLLKNAIKFTPNGGRIGIHCRSDEWGRVVAEVIDSGIGMDTSALSKLFHPFEQLDRSITRQFGGLGLGLTISKAIVEMHGGEIEAHSEGRNNGATFRLRLPLIAPASQPGMPLQAPRAQRPVRPLHILLAEDHPVTAQMMRMVLTERGHSVETASDVATGLELASQHVFDLLVSDLGLPDGSGHDLIRELRTRGHKLRGIALSGHGQREDIQRSLEAGFAAHLIKPATRETIVEAVASVMAEKVSAPLGNLSAEVQTDSAVDASIFDPDEAIRRCLGSKEMFNGMIEMLFSEVGELFPRMHAALQEGDSEEVGKLGHRVLGTVSYLAARQATDAARKIEHLATRPSHPSEVEEAIKALEQHCVRLRAAVAAYRTTTSRRQTD